MSCDDDVIVLPRMLIDAVTPLGPYECPTCLLHLTDQVSVFQSFFSGTILLARLIGTILRDHVEEKLVDAEVVA